MSSNQKGSALILVIWILSMVGVVVMFMIYQSEAEQASIISLEQKTQLQKIAEEVLQERLVAFTEDDSKGNDTLQDPWYANGRFEIEHEDGYRILVLIEDEGSKLNLNLLTDLGLSLLLDGKAPSTPVLDWRDYDSEVRTEGAEDEYYQSLLQHYKSRNGFFSSVEELKALKDGEKLYELLSPYVTVYGKINPNTIDGDIFASLLGTIGEFRKDTLDTFATNFIATKLQPNFYFENPQSLLNITGFTIGSLDVIRKHLKFEGSININMVRKKPLTIMLREMGYDADSYAPYVLDRQRQLPLENITQIHEIVPLMANQKRPHVPRPTDYFTIKSTIVRYRIWVSKNLSKYYLETVQERVPGTAKWEVYPLSWKELFNHEVPRPPAPPKPEDEI